MDSEDRKTMMAPSAPDPCQLSGTTRGRYRIEEQVGRGGMGVVYRAFDTHLERIVALKVLLPQEGRRQKALERFLREAKITAQLRHPHIVTIYDMGQHDGLYFLAMDFIEGISLKAMAQPRGIAAGELVPIMRKICQAIDYAHAHGVLHRDLKPANIMIDKQGEPKVMDFGLAKLLHAESQLSSDGVTIGTLNYMPPEQVEGKIKQVDRRSDVYALGATMYEALSGQMPFDGPVYNTIYRICVEPLPPLTKINAKITPELDAICRKAMHKDRRRRYTNVHAMLEDLDRFGRGDAPRARTRAFGWRRMAMVMAAGAIVGAGLLGYLAMREIARLRGENEQLRKQLVPVKYDFAAELEAHKKRAQELFGQATGRVRKEPDQAIQFFRQSLTVYPDYMASLRMLFFLHCEKKEYREASEYMQKIYSLNSTAIDHDTFALATVHANLGETDKAINMYADAIKLSAETYVKSCYWLAFTLHHNKGDFKGTLEALECMLRVKPESFSAYSLQALTHLKMGNAEEVKNSLGRAMNFAASDEEKAKVYFNMAIFRQEQGELEKTQKAFANAIQISPHYKDLALTRQNWR